MSPAENEKPPDFNIRGFFALETTNNNRKRMRNEEKWVVYRRHTGQQGITFYDQTLEFHLHDACTPLTMVCLGYSCATPKNTQALPPLVWLHEYRCMWLEPNGNNPGLPLQHS